MGYWKSKVLPKIKKVFEKDSTKKAGAAEACKSFDDSKEEINKELEAKKAELQPKVIEIYESSSAEIKGLVKEPKEGSLKKSSAAFEKFIQELVKIELPGSKPVSEACSKYGVAYVSGPVLFILEKVSTYITVETPQTQDAPKSEAEAAESKDKEAEIVVEESKTEAEAEAAASAPEASEEVPAVAEPEPEPAPEPPKDKEEVTPAA